MYLNLHALARYCGPTGPDVSRIQIIDPDDLVTQPRWHHGLSILELEFKAGKAAYYLSQTPWTGKVADKTRVTTDGDVFDYSITFSDRKVRIEAESLRARLRNRRVHILTIAPDGKQRYFPWAKLLANADTGSNNSPNGYQWSADTTLLRPAPWVNGVVNVIGPPYVPPTTPGGDSGFTPIEVVTTSDSHTYTLPAGRFLMAIFIKSTVAQTVSIGYSAGSSELAGPVEMPANVKCQFGDNWLYPDTSINIHISGLQGTNQIELCVL